MLVIFEKAALRVAVLAALLFAPLSARAEESADDALARARVQLDHQDYRQVLSLAEPLGQDESVPLRVRLEALELMGVSELLLRRQERAQSAFEALLALDPGHALSDDSYPPRISEFLEMVRQSLGPPREVEVLLGDELPPSVDAGERLDVTARLGEGAGRVASVVLLARTDQAEDYAEHPMDCDAVSGTCVAAVPVPGWGEALEVYVEARAPSGHRLGGVGTATEPMRLSVVTSADAPDREPTPEQPRAVSPWYSTWWFWTVVGVGLAAIAGGVTAGVLLSEPPEPEPGTMGTARLP